MKNQFANQLVAFVVSLFVIVQSVLSNPQRVRLIVTVIAVSLMLAALFAPSLTTLADHMGGGGG